MERRAGEARNVVAAQRLAVWTLYLTRDRLHRVEGDLVILRFRVILGGIHAYPGMNQRRSEVDVRNYLLAVGWLPHFAVIVLLGEDDQVAWARQAYHEERAVGIRVIAAIGIRPLIQPRYVL